MKCGENPKGNKESLVIEGDVVSCLYEIGVFLILFLLLSLFFCNESREARKEQSTTRKRTEKLR